MQPALIGLAGINLLSRNPQAKKLLDYVLSQGLSSDEVESYISGGQGLTESQRSEFGRKIAGRSQLTSFLNTLKTIAGTAATAYAGYRAVKGASSMAKRLMGTAEKGDESMASRLMRGAKSVPVQTIVGGIAQLFGFKNKKVIDAISSLASKTGKDIKSVYDDLSQKYDISTPEKATAAAGAALKELTGEGKVVSISEIYKGTEKLATAKTAVDTRRDLAKSLKSSTIRRMNYRPADQQLDIIFNSGATYRYHDFPANKFNELSAAGTPAKTAGSNEFGVWWVGKNPSLGATFNRIIKPGLKGAGPYRYERIATTAMSAAEEDELSALQQPTMEKAKGFVSGEEKASAMQQRLPQDKVLSPQQLDVRSKTLNRQLDSLQRAPMNAKTKEAIQIIENRLQRIKENEMLLKMRKKRVITEEILRMEKQSGEYTIRKLLTLVPKSIAVTARKMMSTTSENDVLQFLIDALTAKK